MPIQPICTGCNKTPDELEEYAEAAKENDMSADQYCMEEEGTYNPANGHFLCTTCYIDAGMPAIPYPGRWVAP
jgi:hypothetical protein